MVRTFLCLALLGGSSVAARAAFHTFDTDAQGWRIADYNVMGGTFDPVSDQPQWMSGGGANGGSISVGDVAFWTFFAAPSDFLGDQSGAFGTQLTYDTRSVPASDEKYPAVVLVSGTTFLHAYAPAPETDWTGVSIPLRGASWYASLDPYAAPVDDATLRSVLSNLDGLYIEADWNGGMTEETTGLDNVRLDGNPVPEPATILPMGLGALLLGRRRFRRSP